LVAGAERLYLRGVTSTYKPDVAVKGSEWCLAKHKQGVLVEEVKMSGRENTIVCSFDQRSPRLSAYDIHEWIDVTMNLREDEVTMVQIDGADRRCKTASVRNNTRVPTNVRNIDIGAGGRENTPQ
jgi:hypothetical protein